MKLSIEAFVTECHIVAALLVKNQGKLTRNVTDALDNLGADFEVAPRAMVLHAVEQLMNIDPDEVDAAPGLAVPHWLVLGELIPDRADKEFRKRWAIRTQEMGFTAKALKVELEAGIAARKAQAGR